MLKLISFLILASISFAQSPLLTLMDDEQGLASYPKTDDLVHSYNENGMTAAEWTDQTGSIDFVQTTEGNQPALISSALNGYPSLRFDGVNDFMETSSDIVIPQPFTIYMVIKTITWTNNDNILNGANRCIIAQGYSSSKVYMSDNISQYEPYTDWGIDTYIISTMVFNGASSIMQINSGSPATGNVGTGDLGLSGFNTFLGSTYGGGDYSNIEIVAMYIHSSAHDLTTRTEIINWLNTKYGIF